MITQITRTHGLLLLPTPTKVMGGCFRRHRYVMGGEVIKFLKVKVNVGGGNMACAPLNALLVVVLYNAVRQP